MRFWYPRALFVYAEALLASTAHCVFLSRSLTLSWVLVTLRSNPSWRSVSTDMVDKQVSSYYYMEVIAVVFAIRDSAEPWFVLRFGPFSGIMTYSSA